MKDTVLTFCFVLMGVCWIGMAYCLSMLRRNEQVGKYRQKVIDNIHEHSLRDIGKGVDSAWRWKEFESVPYHIMVYQFWKPLKSFYEGSKLERELWDV